MSARDPVGESLWFSPLRGPWLTTILGSLLLAAMTIIAITGFVSHAAYQPDLGRNAIVPRADDLQLLVFDWPASPTWLYAVTQGLHVTIGFAAVPLLLAKLWSVIPRFYAWPPVRSPAHALERLSLVGLVGGALFEVVTGVFNAQLYYPWHFDFVVAHYYGAWVFVSALILHVAVKLPTMRDAYRTRRALLPEPYVRGGLAPRDPEPETLTRRGLLALVGAASGALLLTTAGQSIGGPLRRLAILAPRGEGESFPVNKTAATARVTVEMTGDAWRLLLRAGDREVGLTRAQLEAMPQHTHDLPIACVEGWSTTQRWTGVRLAALAQRAGLPDAEQVRVASLQPRGRFRQTTLGRDQLHAEQSLLALKVNGEDLPLDHGYPARVIVPALPGVHNTKWVATLEFA